MAATAVLAIVLVVLGIRHRRQGQELVRVREKYTHEASSHYRTYNLLLARERQIGRLGEQLRGLEEIATSSAMGAQLYQALITDLRAPRGEVLDQDAAFSASPAPSAPSAHL